MDRFLRPGLGLTTAIMLGFAGTVHAADYLLDAQARVAQAESGTATSDFARFDAFDPDLAVAEKKYLALFVWSADDAGIEIGEDENGEDRRLVDNEFEIVAKFASTLALASNGPNLRISTMGDDEETDPEERVRFAGREPAVAWNPAADEFLVVWSGDDDTAPLVDDEFEIFGQRVSIDGSLVGDRIRISIMGDDNESDPAQRARFAASKPDIAVDPDTGNYLVTWRGDDDNAPLVESEFEIFGRVLDSEGAFVGEQFRISTTGDDSQTSATSRAKYDANAPAVAFNPVSDNFVVAWHADGNQDGMVNGEHEIFARSVSTAGEPVGTQVRVSHAGVDGAASVDALKPALAVRAETGAVLIAWQANANEATPDDFDIYAQLLDVDLNPLGAERELTQLVSDSRDFNNTEPAVSWGEQPGQFIVAWRGEGNGGNLVDDEFEIFASFVNGDNGTATSQFRVSYQGDDDEEDAAERVRYEAQTPVAAYSASAFIIAWDGDTNLRGGSDNRYQIFGRRVAKDYTELGLELVSKSQNVVAPEPFEIEMKLTNDGKSAAVNTVVRVEMSTEFPHEWTGCESVTEDGHCFVGDVQPGDEMTLTLTLSTDDVEFNGNQSTQLEFFTVSDTALDASAASSFDTFAGVTVELEGGRGALGMPLLALLGLLPLLGLRRRRS